MSGVAGPADLAALIDRLREVDPATLGDGETVVALHRELERLGAVTTRATAAFDASGQTTAGACTCRRASPAAGPSTASWTRSPGRSSPRSSNASKTSCSGTAPVDGKRPDPLFTVLVGYETFAGRICELANGTVVTPASLVP